VKISHAFKAAYNYAGSEKSGPKDELLYNPIKTCQLHLKF